MANEFAPGALVPEFLHDRLISTPRKMALRVAKAASATLSPMSPTPQSFTDLGTAIANQLQDSMAMVVSLNASEQKFLDIDVLNYNTSMAAGQVTADKIPLPRDRYAWVLLKMPTGFTFYEKSDTVKLTPTVPLATFNALDAAHQPKVLNVINIGHPMGGKWYACGDGDTFPSGMTTPPQADGHTYEKFGAPVGNGWYLQVS